MFGKASLIIVLGFSAIFFTMNSNYLRYTTDATRGYAGYYSDLNTANISSTGANIACNYLFLSHTWSAGITNRSFSGGVINVTLDSVTFPGKVMITSIGTYQTLTRTTKVLLQLSSTSKFAMLSANVSAAAKLRDGDTIDGPIHFNNELATKGSPVFIGKATMGSLKTTSGSPIFLGGYQTGVNIPFPEYTTSANAIVASASAVGGTNDYQVGGQMYLRFSVVAGVTHVEYKSSSAAAWGAPVNLAAFAPTGNIAIVNGALHVEGTIKGAVSITSTVTLGTSPSATVGSTYINGNLRYFTDPLTTPSSTDMLGLVSAGNITINVLPIRMDGSYYTNGSATLGGSLNNISPEKQLKIVGSLMSRDIGSTDFGTGSGKGANFYMKYDTRLETLQPVNFPFPKTGGFEILSWYE